jgi:hypothetical protein
MRDARGCLLRLPEHRRYGLYSRKALADSLLNEAGGTRASAEPKVRGLPAVQLVRSYSLDAPCSLVRVLADSDEIRHSSALFSEPFRRFVQIIGPDVWRVSYSLRMAYPENV